MRSFTRVLSFLLILSFAACAGQGIGKKPSYPTALNDQMRDAFSVAEDAYAKNRFSEADKLYRTYISAYGYNELTDQARFKVGEIYFMKKDYSNALSFYKEAYQKLYNPEVAPKAQFKAALSLNMLGKSAEVLPLLEQMKRKDQSAILSLRVDSLAVRTAVNAGSTRNDIIKWYLFLIDDYSKLSPNDHQGKVAEKLVSEDTARGVVAKWVKDANVTLSDITALPMNDMKGKPSGGYVTYKLAMTNYAQGNSSEATALMKKFVRTYPKNEFATDAVTLLAGLKGKSNGKTYRVGVILPLSGKFSLYGNSTLHGIQCAAGLVPPCESPVNVELIVKDTMGDPGVAATAVDELTKENVVAIVGPLLSNEVGAVAAMAEEKGIPLISLSQKEEGAQNWNFVFKHSLTSRDQVDTLVEYATENRKIKKFGILYPDNAYGSQFASLFRSAVDSAGGKIIFQKGYNHGDLKLKDPSAETGAVTSVDGPQTDGVRASFAVPSEVQALFIPDSYKAVGYVVTSVHNDSTNLAPNILYMGVNRWNNPGLTNRDMGLLEGAVFVDGFYQQSSDMTTRNFVQDFTTAFRMEPTILEAQAYDALRLVIEGIDNGGSSRGKLASALKNIKEMGGVTGTISIGSDGESRRKLFILTVKNGAIAELSSARGIIKNKEYTYSSTSQQLSEEKYEGRKKGPDLTVRGDSSKYESNEFFNKEME